MKGESDSGHVIARQYCLEGKLVVDVLVAAKHAGETTAGTGQVTCGVFLLAFHLGFKLC